MSGGVRGSSRLLPAVVTGVVVGVVSGVVLEVAVWAWAFGAMLAGDGGVTVPFVVSTGLERGEPVAQGGIGVLLVPVAMAVLGGVGGWLSGGRRRRRPRGRR